MKKIKTGSDFSGVGALEQALAKLNIKHKTVFACDKDTYARESFIANYGEPKYFPDDVYNREIPKKSLDLYMTSPPCQSFSLAGGRKGEDDDRGLLFYNSHEFIKVNKPRFFIFENVKGLLSDKGGSTFARWINMLGGKSVNKNTLFFPHKESVPYHVYYKVLNAKHYGVPQNRERIFIVGIRDDVDNVFSWPEPIRLKKRLIDVLEPEVDSKYYLSEKMIKGFIKSSEKHKDKGTGFVWKPKSKNDIANCLRANGDLCKTDNAIVEGYINQDTQASIVLSDKGVSQTLCAGSHGYANGYVKIDRVIGRNPENPKARIVGQQTEQMLEINESGVYNCLTTVQKDNVVKQYQLKGGKWGKTHEQSGRVYDINGISPTINTMQGGNTEPKICTKTNIRKLTPRECFRLMGFEDSFKFVCSDSQLYKQAVNSIVKDVLAGIIGNLKL